MTDNKSLKSLWLITFLFLIFIIIKIHTLSFSLCLPSPLCLPVSSPLSLSFSLSLCLSLSSLSVSPSYSLSLFWMSFCITSLYCCILLRFQQVFSHNHKKDKVSFSSQCRFYFLLQLPWHSSLPDSLAQKEHRMPLSAPPPTFSTRVTGSNGLSTPSSGSLEAFLSLADSKVLFSWWCRFPLEGFGKLYCWNSDNYLIAFPASTKHRFQDYILTKELRKSSIETQSWWGTSLILSVSHP